jgi:hypothetical protein
MRLAEISKIAEFLGTCVNSFDEDGECTVPQLYRDVSDFAYHEENAQKISSKEFYNKVGKIPTVIDSQIGKNREYLYDEDNKIYMIYDVDSDVHYFFKV